VKGYPANGSALYGSQFFTLIAAIQHPFSRGSVHINSSYLSVPPIIDPKYLLHEYDFAAIVSATKYLRQVATATLSSVWEAEYEPGVGVCKEHDS